MLVMQGTAFSGGDVWKNPELLTKIREFVYNGGGFCWGRKNQQLFTIKVDISN